MKILWLINEIENIDYEDLSFYTARWIEGKENLTGDAVETTSLLVLLSQCRLNIFSTIHTFAYRPQAMSSSVFLNEAFSNRFKINLVSGWKEDELNYFGIKESRLNNRYEELGLWLKILKMQKHYSGSRNVNNLHQLH